MVETVSQSTFNFSSDFTPYSFASTMRTCYANSKIPSIKSNSESSSTNSSPSNNSPSLNITNLTPSNPESRRNSGCNEMYLRNSDHICNNKRCSNTITTTCVNGFSAKANKPKLQLTTTTFEDNENNLLSCCTTQLSTPQSNGMISHKHQFSFDNAQSSGHQRISNSSNIKQKRSESLGFYRQYSEANDNNLVTSSFEDTHENSNSSEDDLVFAELSSSPSLNHHNYQPKSPRQIGNSTFVLCKRCNGSNSSLTSFSSISSVSSINNLNHYTLTNNNSSQSFLINPQDNLINNLSQSLNQTFSFTSSNNSNTSTNNLSTPQYGRSRHNSINSLTLNSNVQQADRNLDALHKALHNIFSN